MKATVLLPPMLIFFVSTLLPAQDYFPLEKGNEWIYNILNDSDGSIEGQYTIRVNEADTVEAEETLVVYTLIDDRNMNDNSSYFYSLLSSPNEIYVTQDYDDVLSGQCVQQFNHIYSEGDTLNCDFQGQVFVSQYYGEYETTEGIVFNDCWLVFQPSDIEGENLYYFAPNVGLVAFRDYVGERPESELSSINFDLLSSVRTQTNTPFLYPNPVRNQLNVDPFLLGNADYLYMLDGSGKTIRRFSGKGLTRVDVSDLDPGRYYIIAQKDNILIWKDIFIKV